MMFHYDIEMIFSVGLDELGNIIRLKKGIPEDY